MLDLMYDFVIPCNFQDIRGGDLIPKDLQKQPYIFAKQCSWCYHLQENICWGINK